MNDPKPSPHSELAVVALLIVLGMLGMIGVSAGAKHAALADRRAVKR
jgi:hypothetical protein